MITCAIGVGISAGVQYLSKKKTPPVTMIETKSAAPVAVASAPMPVSKPTPHVVLDYDQEKFFPSGYLTVMGTAPKGLKDLLGIELDLYGGSEPENRGNIYVSSSPDWLHPDVALGTSEVAVGNFALVTERTLYFTTSPSESEGFQYRFEGEFLVKDFDQVDGKNRAAVRGRLTRYKNGRKIAEHTVTFRFEYIGC